MYKVNEYLVSPVLMWVLECLRMADGMELNNEAEVPKYKVTTALRIIVPQGTYGTPTPNKVSMCGKQMVKGPKLNVMVGHDPLKIQWREESKLKRAPSCVV